MPEGTDASTLLERGRWLAEVCKEKGFRFTPSPARPALRKQEGNIDEEDAQLCLDLALR